MSNVRYGSSHDFTIPRVDLGTCVLIREEVKREIGEARRWFNLYIFSLISRPMFLGEKQIPSKHKHWAFHNPILVSSESLILSLFQFVDPKILQEEYDI